MNRFEHPSLAEVLPNCLFTEPFADTRSESSGIFYYVIPAGVDQSKKRNYKVKQNARFIHNNILPEAETAMAETAGDSLSSLLQQYLHPPCREANKRNWDNVSMVIVFVSN